MEKAARDLPLEWLFTGKQADSFYTATPYAHLVATLLLAGPSKAVRNLACSLLKSLWLVESVKALSSKSVASAQHAQYAMLTLLLHWIPHLSAYPESGTTYFQLLIWILRTTPTLAEQLKTEAGTAKKKTGGSASKALSKSVTPQDRSSPSSSSSGVTSWGKAEALIRYVVTVPVVGEIFGAVKQHNAVLADHLQAGTYQQLQVCSAQTGPGHPVGPVSTHLFTCLVSAHHMFVKYPKR